jgi:hypothetical protein
MGRISGQRSYLGTRIKDAETVSSLVFKYEFSISRTKLFLRGVECNNPTLIRVILVVNHSKTNINIGHV